MHRHSHLRTTKVRIPQYTVFSVVACPNRSARSCGDISRQYASCCRKEEEDIAICILTCRQYTRSSNSDTGEASMCMVAEAWFLGAGNTACGLSRFSCLGLKFMTLPWWTHGSSAQGSLACSSNLDPHRRCRTEFRPSPNFF